MNIESELVSAYNSFTAIRDVGYEAFTEVQRERDLLGVDNTPGSDNSPGDGNTPSTRFARMVTVERVGGGRADVRDLPLVAVQVWAPSRWEASETAMQVADFTRSLAFTHASIARVDIESVYNNPDPDSSHPRYQITAKFVTT